MSYSNKLFYMSSPETIDLLVQDINAVLYCMYNAPSLFYEIPKFTFHESGGRSLSSISLEGTMVLKRYVSSTENIALVDENYLSMSYYSLGSGEFTVLDDGYIETMYSIEEPEKFLDEAYNFQESVICAKHHMDIRYFYSKMCSTDVDQFWVNVDKFHQLTALLHSMNRYNKIHDFYKLDRANRASKA